MIRGGSGDLPARRFGDDEVADVVARCAAFELSPSGPLPGPDCLAAAGDQGELEAAVLEALELETGLFDRAPGGGTQGARRPLARARHHQLLVLG